MLSYKVGLAVLILGSGLLLQFIGINGQQLVTPPWDGVCPNNTANLSAIDWNYLNGTWYLYGATDQLYSEYFKCHTRNITVTNGSIFFVDMYYSVQSNTMRNATGEYVFDYENNLVYLLQMTPIETVITYFWEPVATNNAHIFYSCNECGYYGTQDSGIKHFVFVRDQFPDCLSTDPVDEALGNYMISLIDHRNCTLIC